MNIVHVATFTSGGAGKAALRLSHSLKTTPMQSKLLTSAGDGQDDSVEFINEGNNLYEHLLFRIRRKLISKALNSYEAIRTKKTEFFNDDRTAYRIDKHPIIHSADIIHLHWIAAMVDCKSFFNSIGNKPVVWTLHDSNPFTGGCCVPLKCTRYEIGCGACPQLCSKKIHDLSRQVCERKKRAYRNAKLNIITPSKWLAGCAVRSSLFRDSKISVIPYGVPTSLFIKRDKYHSRDLLNLPRDKKIIIFGSNYQSQFKGTECLIRALQLLSNTIDVTRVALVVFGAYRSESFHNCGCKVYSLRQTKDESLLAYYYSSADMLVMPSLSENFPNMILESFSCGVPVVGFSVGGIPEIIAPGKTGLLAAEAESPEQLAECLQWMINHPEECDQMGKNARKLVEQKYSLEMQAKMYQELYDSILIRECRIN